MIYISSVALSYFMPKHTKLTQITFDVGTAIRVHLPGLLPRARPPPHRDLLLRFRGTNAFWRTIRLRTVVLLPAGRYVCRRRIQAGCRQPGAGLHRHRFVVGLAHVLWPPDHLPVRHLRHDGSSLSDRHYIRGHAQQRGSMGTGCAVPCVAASLQPDPRTHYVFNYCRDQCNAPPCQDGGVGKKYLQRCDGCIAGH